MGTVTDPHLSIGVFDGRYITLPERTLDEPQHQRALPDSPGPENDHPIIITLLRHFQPQTQRFFNK